MQKYLYTLKMSFYQTSYFGVVNLVGGYLMKALRLAALLMIWTMLFSRGVDGEGMTLGQMLSYTLLSAAFNPLLDVRTPIPELLHEGKLTSLYQRPMGVFGQLTAQSMGSWGMHFAVFALPCLLLVAPLAGIDLMPQSPWVALSLLLTVSQGFAIDYIFGCLIIQARNLFWQINGIRWALAALLTGSLIPFAILPPEVGQWLAYSPFGTLAGAPLAIWTGLAEPFPLVWAQLAWNVILWPVAILWFRHMTERMVSYGG